MPSLLVSFIPSAKSNSHFYIFWPVFYRSFSFMIWFPYVDYLCVIPDSPDLYGNNPQVWWADGEEFPVLLFHIWNTATGHTTEYPQFLSGSNRYPLSNPVYAVSSISPIKNDTIHRKNSWYIGQIVLYNVNIVY